ncbi:MAG: hypothetical protein LIQ30_07835, partial [Planctomycetes bacterium]|nr:hypothetical protein [Planctomycetota bacterium]
LDAQTADLADAIAAETESRVAADIALDRRIDNEKASLLQRIDENKANLARLDDDKMPKAPDNGAIYVGSGGTWLPLVFDIGDPFVYDADGDVVIVERPAYLTNSIWVIHPNELIVSEACQPGNRDSIFIVDADGDIVIQ